MIEVHQIVHRAEPHGHYVQFYKADEPLLNRNVASFLWDGLLAGDGLLVIATPQRRSSLTKHLTRLGADVDLAIREGQLAMVDARQMLDQFLVDGRPDGDRFAQAIGQILPHAAPRVPSGGIRAYGEMVGLLWEAGRLDAAFELEEYWNQLLERGGVELFCGYPIDVFGQDFSQAHTHRVLCAHSQLMPTGSNGDLGDALDWALNEQLGGRAEEVRSFMRAGMPSLRLSLPDSESAILWLRHNVPDEAGKILACAKQHYNLSRAGCAK